MSVLRGPAGRRAPAPDPVLWSRDLPRLLGLATALGADSIRGWSREETRAIDAIGIVTPPPSVVRNTRRLISDGLDPLGCSFCRIYRPEQRRSLGQTYTPLPIVEAMLAWADDQCSSPARVVDPGIGSARFAVAAGRTFQSAELVGVEVDPASAIIGRAHLAAAGMADRATILLRDFRDLRLQACHGKTLYLGNPPYVRHHQLSPGWKEWLVMTARAHGLSASKLAGLHVHFFLAIASLASKGDFGAVVTSAEWLDVNYGSLVRDLLLDSLGGHAVHVVEPTAAPFEGTATTAAITCFNVGSRPESVRLRRHKVVSDLGRLGGGRTVSRARLAEASRWTPLMRAPRTPPEGYIELGELCRVHRGAVTGANSTWVRATTDRSLPSSVLTPSVTRARELFDAGPELASSDHLKRVVELPEDLDAFDEREREIIDRFLHDAKLAGCADGYVARNRRAWWAVKLPDPAPILATYMARRPPAFVRNLAMARHINIAHGIYPREPLAKRVLDRLAESLRSTISVHEGRTYSGGLTKFEPREMERLFVPDLAMLSAP